MNLISFKSLRLFKRSAGPPKGGQPPPARSGRVPRREALPEPVLLSVSSSSSSWPISCPTSRRKTLPELKAGEIATADIIAPADLTVEDTETTEARRQATPRRPSCPSTSSTRTSFSTRKRRSASSSRPGRHWLKTAAARQDYRQLQKTTRRSSASRSPRPNRRPGEGGFSADLGDALLSLIGKVSVPGHHPLQEPVHPQGTRARVHPGPRAPRPKRRSSLRRSSTSRRPRSQFVADVNKLELPARKKGLLISLGLRLPGPQRHLRQGRDRGAAGTGPGPGRNRLLHDQEGQGHLPQGRRGHAEDTLKWVGVINQTLSDEAAGSANFVGTFLLFALLFIDPVVLSRDRSSVRQGRLKDFLMMGLMLVLALLVYKLLASSPGPPARTPGSSCSPTPRATGSPSPSSSASSSSPS